MPSTGPRDVLESLRLEAARSRRFGQPMSVAVIAPARHPTRRGSWRRRRPDSLVLREALSHHLRRIDVLAVDGERVLVIAPGAGDAGGELLASRLREVAADRGMPVRTGVATYPDDGPGVSDVLATATDRIDDEDAPPTPQADADTTLPTTPGGRGAVL